MAYKFIQGIDYGPRAGTLAFVVHMTEGGGGIGDAIYLAQRAGETVAEWKTRVRGVSANFVIIDTGQIIQMVSWGHASGSMAPGLEGDTSGFYNRGYLHDVFGDHWTDPNAYAISVEIAGRRAVGPNRAQVEALVDLVAEARDHYPTMRGAIGHHDQTPTKGCPGTAALMLEEWGRIAHGLFPTEDEVAQSFICVNKTDSIISVPIGTWLYVWSDFRPDALNVQLTEARDMAYLGKPDGVPAVAYDRIPDGSGGTVALFLKGSPTIKPAPPVPPAPATYAVTVAIGGETVTGNVTLP